MKRRTLACTMFSLSIVFASSAYAGPNEKELYFAIQGHDIEAMKTLLAKGADANHFEGGRPLLGWAAQGGNAQVVELLLKAGAKPNVADEGIGHTPLMRAIETQQPGAILLLLKAKADPNAKTPDGKTCMTMAVESRKPKVVQALIVAGADVKQVSADGGSPVLTAAQDGMEESYEIIRILGKAGAEMNKSNAAYTPLVYAIEQSNVKLITTLLEAGASPDAPTESGRTPLSAAISNTEIVQLLLNAKANPNAKNGSGETPLAEAIYNDQIEVVKMLLSAGADVQKAGPNDTSALDYAQLHYRNEIIALLKSNAPEAVPNANADTAQAGNLSHIKCTLADAARVHMILHGSLQEQVNAGTRDSEIFRTYGEDTKEYAELLTKDPSEACRLHERLATKYGVESPVAKLNAAP